MQVEMMAERTPRQPEQPGTCSTVKHTGDNWKGRPMQNFKPMPTKVENISEAHRWLDKAVKLEADGKSAKMVSMAFDKALAFENAAFA